MGDQSSWFCARAKPGQDQTAIFNLNRQNFETYYPMVRIERPSQGRMRRESVPVFPNYILVKFDVSASGWHSINATRGVLRLISFSENGSPSRVPHAEIERLKEREKRGELYIYSRDIQKGDRVRVRSGYAVDALGTVISSTSQRVELLMSLLSRQVRVNAPRHAVEAYI